MYKEELSFLEECLQYNPKSYSSWHQRCFVMLHTPSPDWKRELDLCTKFLSYDERNCKLVSISPLCSSKYFVREYSDEESRLATFILCSISKSIK